MNSHSDAAPSADSDYRPDRPTRYDLHLALAQWPDDPVIHLRHPASTGLAVCGAHTSRYRDGSIERAGLADGPVTCRPCNHWLMRQSLVFAELCALVDVGPTPSNLWASR